MSDVMTLERVREETTRQGLTDVVDRIVTLAKVLKLRPIERTSTTVPLCLRRRGRRPTVFRIDPDCEGSGRAAICFPFWTWPVPDNRVLELLRRDLLDTQPRLDKGGAERDLRLALTQTNADDMIAAICTIYGELWRHLRLNSR